MVVFDVDDEVVVVFAAVDAEVVVVFVVVVV